MWIFEPHVAERIFEDLVAENGIEVVRDEWLDRDKGVRKTGPRIESITMLSGHTYAGRMFFDNIGVGTGGPYAIAYGSIRMEPVFMILGQSAATAASLAIERGLPVQDVPYDALRARLLADGQVLDYGAR